MLSGEDMTGRNGIRNRSCPNRNRSIMEMREHGLQSPLSRKPRKLQDIVRGNRMSEHFLFPGSTPPILPPKTTIQEACVWLLVVLDKQATSRRFVASVMLFHIERGYLTEKQLGALRDLISQTAARYMDGALEIFGSAPAAPQMIEFGNIIPFNRHDDDAQVIE